MKKWESTNTPCRYIYEDIIPTQLPTFNWFVSNDSYTMPLFFPPPIFAKFNSSKENKLFYERYKYYEKVIPEVAERLKKESQKKKQERKEAKNALGRTRINRKANSIFVNFNARDATVPLGPHEEAISTIKRRGLQHGLLEKIKKLFEERPIWSKAALLHKAGIRNDRLKVILPGVAFHFPNGPWRVMWCKYGYDPRTDPNSRIYQTFDFRIRSSDGLKVKVQAKRSYSSNLLHYRAGPVSTNKFSLKDCTAQKSKPKELVDDTSYILKPNMLPPARQMFYQYCDLHIPEIQEMLVRLPEVTKDAKYHYKNGWLPNGFNDQCREIANKYITNHVRKLLLEEKKNRDDEEKKRLTSVKTEMQSKIDSTPPSRTIMDTLIIIDDDEDEGNNYREGAADTDDSHSGGDDDIDGNGGISDSDDEDDRGNEDMDDDDHIDMEAVEEINKIIGNMNEPETQIPEEDEDEEYDPELIMLYHKLIESNMDSNVPHSSQ